MLPVAYHCHWNVAHKDCAHDGALLLGMQAYQLGTDAVGHAPAVDDGECLQSVQLFYTLGIGLDFGLCLVVTLLVNNDGKAVAPLVAARSEREQQAGGKAGED